jgi:hypothetical protein
VLAPSRTQRQMMFLMDEVSHHPGPQSISQRGRKHSGLASQ